MKSSEPRRRTALPRYRRGAFFLGGTLLTFPALVGLGIPALVANATSTVALWPGAVASMWGYSDLLVGMRSWVARFAIPRFVGGLVGAVLLIKTPPSRFDAIVP